MSVFYQACLPTPSHIGVGWIQWDVTIKKATRSITVIAGRWLGRLSQAAWKQKRRLPWIVRGEDGDCQNLRHELLIEQSLEDVSFTSWHRCTLKTCRWLDPCSGNVLEAASDLNFDHVVPLSHAHVTGGYSWPTSLKREFAQDRSILLLVTDSINRSQGAKGPSGFLPAESFQCEYARIWKSVAEKYSLELPDRDNTKIWNILKRYWRYFSVTVIF